ncbi:MAG: TonB-dependent receptor, partial [Acidobacteria bacterium]|nr:TonB-dependent receptor [Acidobacteriota bacterium]
MENLPLNGRQFANLAATIPGVGLGFHSDPTKSTQYSPQINGGNGRNVNYQMDGGDNNDDTVGGLLQLFPLEAIQEFNVQTARYKAEYGRSNGGVMNIVTKSGTNDMSGSLFTLFRDTEMNARTETEKFNEVEKQDYRRYQYGGSFGGPIARDRVHYFAAAERTQQDTFQAVDTSGLFPSLDGTYGTPYRENLITGKMTANLNAAHYLSVRYGHNTNSQPYGTDPQTPPSAWGQSENKLKSFNVNHNWVLGGSRLNEFIFQVAVFRNHIAPGSLEPFQSFPNGVAVGQSPNVPQTTEQTKWQFRDDFSWHVTGMGGIGHEFKVGVNFINEPRLFLTFNSGTNDYAYAHLDNSLTGPISDVSRNGDANVPTKQTGLYVQDDWRVSDRLTLNLGLRYDLNTGFAIDQSRNRNFVILQEAGRSGRLQGIVGFEDFGKEPKEDRDNVQPRAGFAYDVRGNGKDIIRGGWGIYHDFGYTNANVLFAALNAVGGSGTIFSVSNTGGIRNPDGSLFTFGQPVSNIASQNEADPTNLLNSHIASPRIKQPYARQASIGWSHQVGASIVVDVDYVHTDGRDLGWRPRLNQRPPGVGPTGRRSLADLGISPANFRINVSQGRSTYDGLNVGIRRRMTSGVSFSGWYSLSKAKSTTGQSSDELDSNNIQNHLDPFADVQEGPALRTDARHRFTFSGVLELPYGFQISPIFRFRSALPVALTEGVDLNQDGVNNDLPTTAFKFDGFD